MVWKRHLRGLRGQNRLVLALYQSSGSFNQAASLRIAVTISLSKSDEEEEEEDESDEEMPQELSLSSNESSSLTAESMEPPSKLARTDSRGIFVQALPSS